MSGSYWPKGYTDEEIREAILNALRERDRPSLEQLASKLEDAGGIMAGRIVRGIADTKPRLH
jgi:hypothetical protein